MALRWAVNLEGKVFSVFGKVDGWPSFLGADPVAALVSRGATVRPSVNDSLDYVVIANKAGKGRVPAMKKAQGLQAAGAKLEILDDTALLKLLRPDLNGARVYFFGEFERATAGLAETHPRALLASTGAVEVDTLDETVDYVVIGTKRAAGRAEVERRAKKLEESHGVALLSEYAYFEIMRCFADPRASGGLPELLIALHPLVDSKRLMRALDMLKEEPMALYSDLSEQRLVGVVRSQTTSGVYSNVLYADGRYACCSQELEECMGLRGQMCKHTMVMIIGLVQAGAADPATLLSWVTQAKKKRPARDNDTLTETLIRYKAAQAGEIDWRPIETLPEDYYAL